MKPAEGAVVRKVLAFMLLFSGCFPAPAATATEVTDFARLIPLTPAGAGALCELPLPHEVYAGAVRRDLGDMAVFNAQGEMVPFALVRGLPEKNPPAVKELPLFPLAGAAEQQQGRLDMQVRTDGNGTRVNLTTKPARGSTGQITSHVVDAGSVDGPVTGFDLALKPVRTDYVGTVRVETSDDLRSWREQVTAAVATLNNGERQLQKDRVEFPAVTSRYYRLSLCPQQGAPRIVAVTARLESPRMTSQRETVRLGIVPVKGTSGEYLAQTDGHMPVDRIRLVFPDDNSLASATFFSRPDDRSPWVEKGCGTLYRLKREAAVVESRPLELAPTTDRYWLIRIRHPGPGAGGRLPQLEIGWQPHRLVFAARGDPPFRLAYGSGRTGSETFHDEGIVAGLAVWERQQIQPVPAVAGASAESGGREALRPRIPAATWRRGALWGALLLGVLILAGMAWRLLVEMRKSS